MKQKLFLAAAFLSAALFSSHLYAQDGPARTDLASGQPAKSRGSVDGASAVSPTPEAATSTISLRAIKDFKYRFTKVTDEHWSRMDKGFVVCLNSDGFKARAYYDPKGHWQASLKYCDETQLPAVIRDVVRRTYYDFPITSVVIVEVPEHTGYYINIEDKKTLKILRVSEEAEIEELHSYVK
jgi:hypothetical protein